MYNNIIMLYIRSEYMDSGVSWRRTISTARLQYPNADQCTTIYLAKQLYLANYGTHIMKAQVENTKASAKRTIKGKLILQGAGI